MSFITKRERVFNEYDLIDLPARSEGKLKAYASCTDARAWSHFCSDKSEHLVEIIKRNNDTCRPKYVPTEAIVNTLMVGKNTEIARLKRKIEEFEQMLAAYDELELTCDQKCEIAKAHAAIRDANKELDELWLDLDLSGFTEGVDSEAFETGKSRGDEPSRFLDEETPRSKGDEWKFEREPTQKDTKSNQAGLSCPCDASTTATDPRIQDMQETIISKDAKLNAMQNTIAVMENDVCEPYCIYAHIYTALEKIFGILCQNDKYKLYLNLMTSGKDTRCIDIKGKILFKLKVLEKFSLALIAPCSQDFSSSGQGYSCYRAEMVARVETTYALTSAESKPPSLDNKRAQLVADIMENEDMKEILSKESASLKDNLVIDEIGTDTYDIDSENLKRLKSLQENYDDLMTCYESLKHEKDCLFIKCRKYEELEKEFEGLKSQLREYNALWNEKEHYRSRSLDLDALRAQFLVLSDETLNLENQMKAESEINNVKTKTIDDLRQENLLLEQKLNEASMQFRKEKNDLECKLKECDCKSMCQDQQIKSLSIQVDRLLEQDPEKIQLRETDRDTIALIDEINLLKEQVKNLKEVICCNDDENQQMQEKLQANFDVITNLKLEMEDLKNTYRNKLQHYDNLEKYTDDCREEIQRLISNNEILSQDVNEKSKALENLIHIINSKSSEIDSLMKDMDKRNKENNDLCEEIKSLQLTYRNSVSSLGNEKAEAIKSLLLARQESQELLEKVKDFDEMLHIQNDLASSYQVQNEEYNNLKSLYNRTEEENVNLKMELSSRDSSNSIYLQEIHRQSKNISNLEDENIQYKLSAERTKQESIILQEKFNKFEDLSEELKRLKDSHEKLISDKNRLEHELYITTTKLDDALNSVKLERRESEKLLQGSDNIKTELSKLNEAYAIVNTEKQALQKELENKTNEFFKLSHSFDILQLQNERKSKEIEEFKVELAAIKKEFDNLTVEHNFLLTELENKAEEIDNLGNSLKTKCKENKELTQRLQAVEHEHKTVSNSINSLLEENISSRTNLSTLKRESDELMQKIKYYETLESKYDQLKRDHNEMRIEKNRLERELDYQLNDVKRVEQENHELSSHSQQLLSHSEDLEKALIHARTELIVKSSFPEDPHADIIKEIEEMKNEKIKQRKKICELLDQLEASENEISKLSELILARDDKVAILENHINGLQVEVDRLQKCLVEVVNTGEQITDHSSQKLNDSLKTMEAHHSRATHNMKMELAKLQSDKTLLEEKLSATKLKDEEITKDKYKYISQIRHLQNEREIIITDIKQLELRSVGDSALAPDNCDIEDVLCSLDRIRRYLDARSSKSTSLEQTLLSVQNSYQLVQTKTDEAKKIVEKEKQKIVNEKEEAVKDKISMEKQLLDLKEQMSVDKKVIKDLEAEILNHKLITDEVNKSTQKFISKLEEEIKNLQLLYENTLNKTIALNEELNSMSQKKSQMQEIIEKTTRNLEEKMKDIDLLNQMLADVKKGAGQIAGVQTSLLDNRNVGSQTEEDLRYEVSINPDLKQKYDNFEDNNDISPVQVNKIQTRDRQYVDNKTKLQNEVQVLTANVDPTFDYVRNSYLNYKLKQLRTGRLEHYSISCASENKDVKTPSTPIEENRLHNEGKPGNSSNTTGISQNLNVIDIYNKQSMHTNSSKVVDNDDTENDDGNQSINQFKSRHKSSALTGFGITNESNSQQDATGSNINNEYRNSNLFGSTSEVSTDKDLFVIYRDSESNHENTYEIKSPWNAGGNSEIVVEAVTIHQNKKNIRHGKRRRSTTKQNKKYEIESDPFMNAEDEDYEEDDSAKHKLKINLPRVEHDSISIDASDGEKKSIDSYTMAIYPSAKAYPSSDYNADQNQQNNNIKTSSSHSINNETYQYTDPMTIQKRDTNENYKKTSTKNNKDIDYSDSVFHDSSNSIRNESHHKLSRVGADVLLTKTDISEKTDFYSTASKKKSKDFGLDYILDSHNDPNDTKTYDAAKAFRKTRSDERLNLAKQPERSDSSPSRLSEIKKSFTEYKTVSSNSYSKSSDKSQLKTYAEHSDKSQTETVEDYENKIQCLTRTLENIEKDYKKKIDAIKLQYNNNIKSILNEHNQGVANIQSLHEETLQDIIKIHENEVENLRSMSIEAMRKADKLEKENRTLKTKIQDYSSTCMDEVPIKMSTAELKRHKTPRMDSKLLSKTNVEAFNVHPQSKSHGPCTCALDINISDTIRNIFEQVDVDQRKMAEYSYLKYIANKILNGNVEALDTQELSFLHLKVCRIWKTKLTKEEALQKRIDSLEAELMNKQKNAQLNIAELDRKVAEERRRLQEVREAVCRNTPTLTRCNLDYVPLVPPPTAEKDFLGCSCTPGVRVQLGERRSAGDLVPAPGGLRPKKTRNETSRAVLVKLDAEERREKKIYTDELPTRLRKSHDRHTVRKK